MRLLDARRLLDHQFTQKTINSAGTKDNMVAEKFNQGFAALPKGGYGVPFEENEITVIYGPLPPERQMTSPQLHDKFQKMCKSSRDIILKLQPDALINAAAFKVQGHGEKSDLDPDAAMALVCGAADQQARR